MRWPRGESTFGALEMVCGGLIVALAVRCAAAGAAPAPSLTVTAQQMRTRAATFGVVPLWDTSWWVTIQAQQAQAPLTRLEYAARFADGPDGRQHTGGWDVYGSDASALSGRVLVKCPARPDYERRVRVQLRVRDALGGASDWAVAEFPVRDQRPSAATARAPAPPEDGADGRDERLGVVEIEVTDDMTIGQMKAQLQRQARERGGDAVGFRTARSITDHAVFAADVVRRAATAPTPPAPPVAVPSERVIGEIIFQEARR